MPRHAFILDDIAAHYAELERVDRALLEAEQQLDAAHSGFASRQGPRPEGCYAEVLSLRARSRRLMDRIADLFLSRD